MAQILINPKNTDSGFTTKINFRLQDDAYSRCDVLFDFLDDSDNVLSSHQRSLMGDDYKNWNGDNAIIADWLLAQIGAVRVQTTP